MDPNQLVGTSISTSVAISAASGDTEQQSVRSGLEKSRKTILYGWIISMIGVVFYCFVMSNSDQQSDLLSVLIAIAITLIGVGFWFAGCVRFLNDATGSTS